MALLANAFRWLSLRPGGSGQPRARRVLGRAAVSLALALSLLCQSARASAATALDEYAVKAAFIYQFIQFVEWPSEVFADPAANIVVGIVGDDPFDEHLRRTTEGRTAQGRRIVVRTVRHGDQLRQCHLLFVSASEEARIPDLLRTLGTANVFTVGDTPGFAQAGGTLNFVMEAARVKFEVNIVAAERARIRISSKLLHVARIVRPGARQS
ncbi:MAG TPA: YfiR family protein [Luteitalea sp.]|nr:YfiR family protein [Luteitalea sp.]